MIVLDVLASVAVLAITLGLHFWARHLAQGNRRWMIAAWLPLGSMGLSAIGFVLTVFALRGAFLGLDGPAAERAQALSNGIRNAMFFTAVPLALSLLVYFGTVVALIIGTMRARQIRDDE